MFHNRLLVLSIAIALLVSACAPRGSISSRSFPQWNTTDALEVFQGAGLAIEIPQLTKDERDVFSNEIALESRKFVIPNQGDPTLVSGIIFSFEKEEDLQDVQDFYAALGKGLPQYDSWIFIKDNLLLQINRSIPEAVAKRYAEALDSLDE